MIMVMMILMVYEYHKKTPFHIYGELKRPDYPLLKSCAIPPYIDMLLRKQSVTISISSSLWYGAPPGK